MSDSNLSSHTYTINGVEVVFPAKAYPSQVAMMSKVIIALQKGQNSLLESPTGSGKSLALLCAALAWQRKEVVQAREYNQAVEEGLIVPEIGDQENGEPMEDDDEANLAEEIDTGGGFFQPENDEDFIDAPNQIHVPFPAMNSGTDNNVNERNQTKKFKRRLVPKIYFGTRTHKQISQIIRELKKTIYKDVKMTILASREHTCINPTVLQMPNKNEGCREMTDKRRGGHGCPFQSNVKSKFANHMAVTSLRKTSDAWDIEDFVKLGKKVRACPYFGTRELKNRAEIIFCPYNYLIEPLIRQSMEINLKGQIVILDEAHNIEDSARSAASWTVTLDEIEAAIEDVKKSLELGIGEKESHKEIMDTMSHLVSFVNENSDKLDSFSDFNSASKVWDGTDICGLFQHYGFGKDSYGSLVHHHDKVLSEWQNQTNPEDNSDGMEPEGPKLKPTTVSVIENLILVLGHLYLNDSKFRDDFKVALIRSQTRKQNNSRKSLGGWVSKFGGPIVLTVTYTINFWCLNPAVSFHELKETVRSIVLTSGTLSPMNSFSSELGVKFPIQLEANHVIDKKQVWIGTLSHGPTGHCLNATFKNSESYGFQDELGRLTLGVCQTVAHGVLVFLPSYRLLENLTDRWKNTSVWEEICKKKVIITEPKSSSEFESTIRHFNEVIETTSKENIDDGSVDGSLLMAVCRGKVSEGLDFADNNARAVICVGIPFPNVKNIQVDLKMRYNDQRRSQFQQQELLAGKDWYEIQAFRALNQALGRCIRHRRDWGAIIMVDDRFSKITRYLNGLSKWVRSGIIHYSEYSNMINKLGEFTKEMKSLDDSLAHLKIDEGLSKKDENCCEPPVKRQKVMPKAIFKQITEVESPNNDLSFEENLQIPSFPALQAKIVSQSLNESSKALESPVIIENDIPGSRKKKPNIESQQRLNFAKKRAIQYQDDSDDDFE